MIPAWTVVPVVFAALTGKYYGLDLFEIIHAKRTQKRTRSLDFWKSKRITKKEWVLVFQYLGIQKELGFREILTVHLPQTKSLGYIVFVILALIFLLVSFFTPYLYALGFSLLSGVMFFVCVRMFLGPKRTWKLTVRTHDSDRYLIPWSEMKNCQEID